MFIIFILHEIKIGYFITTKEQRFKVLNKTVKDCEYLVVSILLEILDITNNIRLFRFSTICSE